MSNMFKYSNEEGFFKSQIFFGAKLLAPLVNELEDCFQLGIKQRLEKNLKRVEQELQRVQEKEEEDDS